MSLSATVSKVSATTTQKNLYNITLKLEITDTEGPGFTKDYSREYRTGENIAIKQQSFLDEMNRDIAYYKNSQNVFKATALNTVVTNLQNGLTL